MSVEAKENTSNIMETNFIRNELNNHLKEELSNVGE